MRSHPRSRHRHRLNLTRSVTVIPWTGKSCRCRTYRLWPSIGTHSPDIVRNPVLQRSLSSSRSASQLPGPECRVRASIASCSSWIINGKAPSECQTDTCTQIEEEPSNAALLHSVWVFLNLCDLLPEPNVMAPRQAERIPRPPGTRRPAGGICCLRSASRLYRQPTPRDREHPFKRPVIAAALCRSLTCLQWGNRWAAPALNCLAPVSAVLSERASHRLRKTHLRATRLGEWAACVPAVIRRRRCRTLPS